MRTLFLLTALAAAPVALAEGPVPEHPADGIEAPADPAAESGVEAIHDDAADHHGTAADHAAAPGPTAADDPTAAHAHGAAHSGHGAHHDPWADEDGDGTPSWMDPTDGDKKNKHYALGGLIRHGVNLVLLLLVLFFAGRGPLKRFLASRAEGIKKEITDAADLRTEAQERHAALQARLDAFDDELQAIEDDAHQRAANEEERIKARAEAMAAHILQSTERNIRDEVTRARASLRAEAVELAVELAESTLREAVAAEDQRRLARQFLATLNADEVTRG